jgi:hypothetical protein
MEDFADAITQSNIPQVNTVLTSVITALAVYQVAMMAVGWGKVKLPFLKPRAASFAHRSVGDVIVPIALLVGWICYAYYGFDDEQNTPTTTRRRDRRSTCGRARLSRRCWP